MSTEAPPTIETAAPSLDPNAAPSTATITNSGAATSTWSREWVKDDGSLDHKAFEKAPDDFKPLAKDLERYKTFDDFLKGHRELASMAGKKGLVEPLPPNATDAQKTERAALLRKVNGAPDKPEGYGLTRPAEVAENLWDQKYADSIAAIAHKHGLPQGALKELAQAELAYTSRAIEENKKAETAWFESQDKLIRESAAKEGMDFAQAKNVAERAGRKLGIDPENPLMKNASVFMMLTRVGRMMSEDSLVVGDNGPLAGNLRMSPEQAGATAKDIVSNKTNPDNKAYWDVNDARHDTVVKRVNSLYVVQAQGKTGGR